MPHRESFAIAIRRYAHARSVTVALRGALDGLKKRGELEGFTVEDFPSAIDKSVQGFDVAFTDKRIRLVISGSTMQKGHVAIECWRVPLVYGKDLASIAVLEVSKDGEVKLPPENEPYWIESPAGAFDLVCHLVELVNAPRTQ